MTESDVETCVRAQRTTAIYEEPEIGLELRTKQSTLSWN